MRHHLLAGVVLLWSVSHVAGADAPRVQKDVAYSAAGKRDTSLDLYAPATGSNHPILVWIHGGGWSAGDKRHVDVKPEAFNDLGFVLVSINYRLHPEVTYKEQGTDVAQAIRWVVEHAQEFGGSPEQIFVAGHSAGAHLAALVATDHRYLEAAGLKLDRLRGVILVDGAAYDVPKQIELRRPRAGDMFQTVFGTELGKQQDASPITHVAKDKHIPPFLILYVADRNESRVQSEALAERLNAAGAAATVVPAENKTHGTINSELGLPNDPPTTAVVAFLLSRLPNSGK